MLPGSGPLKAKGQTPEKSRASLQSLEKQNWALSPCGSNTAQAWGFRARETSPKLVGGGICWGGGLCFSTRGCGGELGGVRVIRQNFVAREKLSSSLPQPMATASASQVGNQGADAPGTELCGQALSWVVLSGQSPLAHLKGGEGTSWVWQQQAMHRTSSLKVLFV